MREIAGRHGLTDLIAPVRPNWKERYPLTPIEQYAAWRRFDGFLFDPWMRVHERVGATVLKPEPRSLRITGTVADCLHHNSPERNGKQLDTDCCIVFELKDGRIISGREHFFDLNNWDEFWS